jgi:hypothetical protein
VFNGDYIKSAYIEIQSNTSAARDRYGLMVEGFDGLLDMSDAIYYINGQGKETAMGPILTGLLGSEATPDTWLNSPGYILVATPANMKDSGVRLPDPDPVILPNP